MYVPAVEGADERNGERVLIAMAGLPGAGKSTVAEALGRRLAAPVVSVDPIEAAMRRAGVAPGQPTGLAAYVVAEAVADGVLALGQNVIVDAVNAVEAARGQWRALAARRRVPVVFLEVVCTDRAVHRGRLAARRRGIAGFPEPEWAAVERLRAEFEPWPGEGAEGSRRPERLVLDSLDEVELNVSTALGFLGAVS
ncbi:AAA family ATPase [Kitasatospora sp. NPDC004272]